MSSDNERSPRQLAPGVNLFCSQLAHELRTPLHGLLGFAELMVMDHANALTSRQLKYLANVESAGHQMLKLLDDVLSLSHAGYSESIGTLGNVDLVSVVHEAIDQAQPHADAHGIEIELEVPDLEAVVVGDQELLVKVVHNLLTNAIKFNRANGQVRVTMHRQPGRCRVAVTDQGPGLTPGQISKLFFPFSPQGPVTSESGTGSGLGLAISRALMERMGGEIQVWSNPGHGATFEIELDRLAFGSPVLPAPVSAGQSLSRVAPLMPMNRPARILFVEDDAINLSLIKSALTESVHCELLIAETGPEALEIAMSRQPDILVSDINLPGISGGDLVGEIRANPALADMICIALSAESGKRQIELALATGFNAFWSKPIGIHDLLLEIRRLTNQ